MFKQLDEYVIQKLQNIYNYLWDYHGLTKGILQVIFMSYGIFVLILRFDTKNINYAQISVISIATAAIFFYFVKHNKQVKNKLKEININAEKEKQSFFCFLIRLPIFLGFIWGNLITMDIIGASCSVAMMLIWYFDCLYVKERNPPENLYNASNPI